MATFLEGIGLLEYFLPVFSFLLVFAIFYAILQKTKILGANKGVDALASFTVGILFLFSQGALKLINIVTPWFALFLIMVVLLVLIFMFLGVKEETIIEATKTPTVYIPILGVIIVIFLFAIGTVFNPQLSPYDQTGDDTNKTISGEILKTIFDVKILSALFILIVASQAVRLLSTPPTS